MAFTFSNLAFYVSSFLLKKMISESHEKMNENFDTIHDDSHLSTSVIVEETEIQPLNNELQTLLLENQTLKNQLDRALQFTNEIENIRSKNSELQSKLHQSQLQINTLQQKLKLSQQKNRELETKLQNQCVLNQELYQKNTGFQTCLNEVSAKLQNAEEKIETMGIQISENSTDQGNFLIKFNKLFSTSFITFSDVLLFIEKYKTDSESNNIGSFLNQKIEELRKSISKYQSELQIEKKSNSTLKKKCARLSKRYIATSAKLSEIKKEAENIKENYENQSRQLNTIIKNSELGKEHENNLQAMIKQIQTDRKNEVEKLKQIIIQKDSRIHELQEQLTNPVAEDGRSTIELIQQISSLKIDNNDLQSKLQQEIEVSNNFKNKAKNATKKLQDQQNNINSLYNKIKEMEIIIGQKTDENSVLSLQVRNANIKIQELEEEIKRNHTNAYQTQNEEIFNILKEFNEKNTMKEYNIENVNKLQNSIGKIESLLQKQEAEILSLSNERKKFVNIVHAQMKILSLYEIYISNQEQKIMEIQNRPKPIPPEKIVLNILMSSIVTNLDLIHQQSINSIIINPEIENSIKIQMICNEINSILNQPREVSLFETKPISCILGNNISKETVIDYITKNLDFKYNSSKLFYGSIEDRSDELQRLIDNNISIQKLADLFTSQILINISEDQEIQKLNDTLSNREHFIDDFKYYFPEKNIEDIVNIIKQDKEKIKVLKKKVKNSKEDNKKNKIIEDLKLNFKNALNDLSKFKSQLEQKNSQFESLQASYEGLQKETSQLQSNHIEEMNKYEILIERKNQEIKTLNEKIIKCSIESDENMKMIQKSNDQLLLTMHQKDEKYQNKISGLQEKIQNMQSAFVKKEQEKRNEIIQLVKIQNDLKGKLNESLKALKENSEEKKVLSQKLEESIKYNESNSQNMSEQMNKLALTNKSLELQIQSFQEQSKREIDVLNSQFSFKILAIETKYKEALNTLKTKLLNEKNKIFLTFLEEFDELNGFDDDLNNFDFQLAIKDIANKYKSLKLKSMY